MKILIVGSDVNAKLIASYLKIEDSNNDIYVTTYESSFDGSYTSVDVKENDIPAIVDFVKYNQIEFTIVTCANAIINGISEEFHKEGFPILAPISESARITFFNSIAKKIMYKLKINTPKFGIFDRENLALEYIRNSKFPIVAINDFNLLPRFNYKFDNFSSAKIGIQKIFEDGNKILVLENYIEGDFLYMYFITDGYNAMPLGIVDRKSNDKYTIALSPSHKVSEDMIMNFIQNIVYPLLDDISKYSDVYSGILGFKFKIFNNSFYVSEFYNGFQSVDFQTILPCLNDNMLKIFYETAIGALADMRDYIKMSDNYSYTVAIDKKAFRIFDEDNEEYDDIIITEDDEKYVLTSTGSTISSAKNKMNEYLKDIINEDTFNEIINTDLHKEQKL